MPKRNSNNIGDVRDEIVSDFQSLAAHAEDLLKATSAASGEEIEKARKQLQSTLKSTRKGIDDLESMVIEQGKAAIEATSDLVRERPWQTLAAVALAGVVVGCLCSGSRSHR